jgi:sortase A
MSEPPKGEASQHATRNVQVMMGAATSWLIKLSSRGARCLSVVAAAATATALCGLLAGCVPGVASSTRAGSSAEQGASSGPPGLQASPAAPAANESGDVVRRHGAADPHPASRALLSIPSIGVHALPVVPYTGFADDRPGTRIEDRGVAASPRGARGGVGPGDVGNLIITAHRTSAGGPLRRLPSLRVGRHILITSGGTVFDYVVSRTMTISFRSKASLARQSAAVPGRPGVPATRAMITLSTCATPEDHARGDFWTDALGNPAHRIDKVGVLVAVTRL